MGEVYIWQQSTWMVFDTLHYRPEAIIGMKVWMNLVFRLRFLIYDNPASESED